MAKRLVSPLHLGDQVASMVAKVLRRAIRQLERIDTSNAEQTVHEVRKACKRTRGIARLVRPGLGAHYRRANAGCRDAARELSPLRDQHARLETFDALVAAERGRLPTRGLAEVRAGLVADADEASAVIEPADTRVAEARSLLVHVVDDLGPWSRVDAADTVDGIASTYRQGRDALEEVLDGVSTEKLHEWRKRVKYLWYQVQTIREAAPSVLAPLAHGLHELADALGDDHDLAVLVERIRSEPDRFGPAVEHEAAVLLAERRRADLQYRAVARGRRLYVEPPTVFRDRVDGYFTAWEDAGPERRTGALADIAPVADDLDELSTTALRRLARRHDVPGRSVLLRPELLAEIRVRRPVATP